MLYFSISLLSKGTYRCKHWIRVKSCNITFSAVETTVFLASMVSEIVLIDSFLYQKK